MNDEDDDACDGDGGNREYYFTVFGEAGAFNEKSGEAHEKDQEEPTHEIGKGDTVEVDAGDIFGPYPPVVMMSEGIFKEVEADTEEASGCSGCYDLEAVTFLVKAVYDMFGQAEEKEQIGTPGKDNKKRNTSAYNREVDDVARVVIAAASDTSRFDEESCNDHGDEVDDGVFETIFLVGVKYQGKPDDEDGDKKGKEVGSMFTKVLTDFDEQHSVVTP